VADNAVAVKRPYVAGPMSRIPKYNVPAFMAVAAELRSRGLRPILPADLQSKRHRDALMKSDGHAPATDKTWGDWLSLDVRLVADEADSVVVLPGWRKSRGARLETFVAYLCGKPVLYYPSLTRVPRTILFNVWMGRGARL